MTVIYTDSQRTLLASVTAVLIKVKASYNYCETSKQHCKAVEGR